MKVGRIHSVYVVGLLAAMAFFNMVDQTVGGALLTNIQSDLHLSDTQLGLTASAFTVALAISAIPLGIWADRGSRRLIIGLGVGVWSLATLATGLTQSLAQFLMARSVVGIGEASHTPAGSSLVADYFGPRSRGRAMSVVVAAAGLGLGGGLILGGVVGLHYGWRAAYYVAGIPGLLLALLAFTIREPLRGAAESTGPQLSSVHDAGLSALGRLVRIRTYTSTVVANAVVGFGFSVLGFTTVFVNRSFGLNSAQAGALVGIPLLAGVVIGVPVAGWLMDRRVRRSPRAAVEIGLSGLLIAALATVLMFSSTSVALFEAGLVISFFAQSAAVLAPSVVLQNVIMPSLRASAASINLTFGRLVGWAAAPLAVGVVSDLFGRNIRLSLLLIVPAAFLVGAGCFAVALGSIARDAAAMEAGWARHKVAVDEPGPAWKSEFAGEEA
jgi:MFS transporter, Spinster family, sphingosine-1-phosphate transporter